MFSTVDDHLSTLLGPAFLVFEQAVFFCFGEPAEGFGSLYLSVSMYCFLTCLGHIILGARRRDFSYGLGVFDFSHEEVKRAVGLHL